jgi:hypothetical protein
MAGSSAKWLAALRFSFAADHAIAARRPALGGESTANRSSATTIIAMNGL